MASIENRFIRIEDWKGNVYYPETNSGSSTAGDVIGGGGASSNPDDPTYTQGNIVSDPDANGGSAIVLSSSSERQTLFRTYFADAKFGNVSIGLRMKSSTSSGTTNIIEVNTYFVDASGETPVETKLDTITYHGNSFGVANEYVNLGFTTNYKGKATGASLLKVEVIVLPDTGATIYFDEIAVAMEMKASASGGMDVHVEDTTVIFETSGK